MSPSSIHLNKESAAPALKALAEHGVSVKVLTGDNELVTTKICHQVKLDVNSILLGSDVERMHGGGHFHSHGAVRQVFQTASSAACLLPDPGGDPAGLYDSDSSDEGFLYPPLRLAMRRAMEAIENINFG